MYFKDEMREFLSSFHGRLLMALFGLEIIALLFCAAFSTLF